MATSAPKPALKAAPKGGQDAVPSGETLDGEAPAPNKSKKKRIVLIAAILLVLGIGGAAAWYFMGQNKENTTNHEAKHKSAKPPVFLTPEPFTVNLQSDGTEQFLQVSFTLQVEDEAQAELIKLYMPQVRSRLLLLLSSKKATEISTAEGKKKLSDEIVAAVKQPFTPGAAPQNVSNVFFTSFVIQ